LLKLLQKGAPFMTSIKYIGMDVHTESISIAVRNSVGKLVMECLGSDGEVAECCGAGQHRRVPLNAKLRMLVFSHLGFG
jgi:hypothetical protein